MKLTLKSYITGVEGGTISPREVLDHYLAKAKEYNKSLNAFVRFHDGYTESHIDQFSNEALHAAPIGVKDIILTKGEVTSCASNMLKDFVSPYSATCFEKLEAAGGLMIGKTNMDEFAMGGSTESSAFGITLNPYGTNRIPGGSSGWSAAAVAADLCIAALGTDTGWSVRQPAALCGIVGIKPTYGRVSRYGVQAMASSLDQVGVMTKTVDDAKLLLRTISGYDPKDAQSDKKADTRDHEHIIPTTLKIAIAKEVLAEGLDPKIRQRLMDAADKLRAAGIAVEEVELPVLSYAVPMYYTLMPAEVSTNMARFDGVRFGHQETTFDHADIMKYYEKVRTAGFGDEVKRRILLGTFVLSSANYEGYYLKAQRARQQLKKDFAKIFKEYDILLSPTAPTVAWKIGEKIDDPLSMYLEDLYTIPANMGWLPAMSVPAGMLEDQWEMMPVGLQLMANRWEEEKLFSLGKLMETFEY